MLLWAQGLALAAFLVERCKTARLDVLDRRGARDARRHLVRSLGAVIHHHAGVVGHCFLNALGLLGLRFGTIKFLDLRARAFAARGRRRQGSSALLSLGLLP